jgi:hypothetical protein
MTNIFNYILNWLNFFCTIHHTVNVIVDNATSNGKVREPSLNSNLIPNFRVQALPRYEKAESPKAVTSHPISVQDCGTCVEACVETSGESTLETRATRTEGVNRPRHRRLLHSSQTYIPWRVSKGARTRSSPRNGSPNVNKPASPPRGPQPCVKPPGSKKSARIKKMPDMSNIKVSLEVDASKVVLALQNSLKVHNINITHFFKYFSTKYIYIFLIHFIYKDSYTC